MKTNLLMNFSVDMENKTISVEREFDAPVNRVWAAWTQSQLLDQWWAPKPWRAETKTMDFKEGGYWLYAMIGPGGEQQWCRADYKSIQPLKSYELLDAFCDPEGTVDHNFPRSVWNVNFNESSGATVVSIIIRYDKVADLEKYIEMGFKEGFTAGLENLDALLAS